ncbi:TagK domain-containing protein [Caballeronia ptereochthonis]|nr:TagK domain-containing protein [Caballeronia ptereochthonis]
MRSNDDRRHDVFDSFGWFGHAPVANGGDPVFDLLDATANPGAPGGSRESSACADPEAVQSGGDPLMDSLYEQYRTALQQPFTAVSGKWVSAATPGSESAKACSQEAPEWARDADCPITSLLGDIQTVDDAFDMSSGVDSHGAHSGEDIPEILGLFAPPEYQGALSRYTDVLPPDLVKREHHALAIDSPIRFPDIPRGIEEQAK